MYIRHKQTRPVASDRLRVTRIHAIFLDIVAPILIAAEEVRLAITPIDTGIDTIHGEPLRTPTLLGTGLLKLVAGAYPVLAYTAVHGLAFILFGIVAAALLAGAEQAPVFLFAMVILFTAFEVFFFGAVIIGAKWILDELTGWTIFVGNILASAAMLAYFFRKHRALARRLTEAFAEDD